MADPADILAFWFEETEREAWFKTDPAFDRVIRDRFLAGHERALAGALADWEDDQQSCLALVILLDQFPRNMFRDSPRAFAGDPQACAVARRALAAGHDRRLPAERRSFLYLPFMHCEELAAQDECLRLFAAMAEELTERERTMDAVRRHRDIIARFGRYPHRNAVLGRPSTPEEEVFLREPKSSF